MATIDTLSTVGWAIVGTGQISQLIASDLRLLPRARRLAVASRSTQRAVEFADQEGFERAYGSIEAMLADPDVQVVYVGTPHAAHSTIAIAALEAGKHVLIEKPMGVDAADARRIAAAARAADRFAMEGMWMRFNPAYRSLLQDVRSGVIGDPQSIRAYFGLPFGDAASKRWSAELHSSTILDQGIYGVMMALELFGSPVGLTAAAHIRDDGVDLTGYATLEFDGGRFAHVAASMVTYLEPTASVSGTMGWLNVPAPFWASTRYTANTGSIPEALSAPRDVIFEPEGFGYVPMLGAVIDALDQGWREHPWHMLDDSIVLIETLDRIRRTMTANRSKSPNPAADHQFHRL